MTKNIKRKVDLKKQRAGISGITYSIFDMKGATKPQAIAFAKQEIKEWQKFIKDMK